MDFEETPFGTRIHGLKEAIRGIDQRSPFVESRRKSDCFPDGGAVCIAIGISSLLSLAIGVAIGAWLF
jgi:hypothetical protein